MNESRGILIERSRCPRCHAELEYSGNYMCSECPWVLPENPSQKEKDAFNVAYVLLMEQTGREPDVSDLMLPSPPRRPWRSCSSCGGVCHFHDTDWVCETCGDEWNEEHDPKYASPGGV